MTKQDVLEILKPLSHALQLKWLSGLGSLLTVSARSGYPVNETSGNITHLIGCNELQHQIFAKARSLEAGDNWPLEEFIDTLFQKAAFYHIEGDFGWALKRSLDLPK